MKSFYATKKSEWQNYAYEWEKFQAPWAPSSERLKIYHDLIKEYVKGKDVLVLGATPSIRDLLAKFKFKVTVIDISPLMIKAMSFLRKIKSKEQIIVDNWLTFKSKQKFDLIIGDSVMNNLYPQQYQRFFKKMKSLLKDDGVFINQGVAPTKPVHKIRITFNQIIKKVKTYPEYYKNYLNRAYDYLSWSCSHAHHHLIDWATLEREYQKEWGKGGITRSELKFLSFGFRPLNISIFTKRELEKILRKHWKTLEVRCEKKHRVHHDFYRIYLLKKR